MKMAVFFDAVWAGLAFPITFFLFFFVLIRVTFLKWNLGTILAGCEAFGGLEKF